MTDASAPDTDETGDAPERRFGEEILLDYVTGTLDPATELMVAAHLELCPEARASVDLMTEIGSVLLEEAEPVAMKAGAFDAVMSVIDGLPVDAQEASAKNVPLEEDELSGLPRVVRDRVVSRGGKWSFVTPGVRALDLGFDAPQAAEASAPGEVKLYRIEPGRGVPTHTHEGSEITLVLTGAFGDGRDRYAPGDICVASPDVTHKPIAEKGATCFALAITDAPLQLTGALGFVQRALSGSFGAGSQGGSD